MKNLKVLILGLFVVAVTGCSNSSMVNESHQEGSFALDFSWEGSSRCFGSSPAMAVSNVPEETAKLVFKLKDLRFPFAPHGGGAITYEGSSVIEKNEISDAKGHFFGPCPPPFIRNPYQFTVKALDSNGNVLGQARAIRRFPKP